MHKALIKANDDLISFCKCDESGFATTGQADCPWCGCGWLFSCTKCRKAFTFAKVIETDLSPYNVAVLDISGFSKDEVPPDDESVQDMADWVRNSVVDIPLDTVCVIVDGKVIPVDKKNFEFNGWFAHHQFDILPQVEAQGSRAKIISVLGNTDYWLSRELPEEDKS